MHGHRLFCFHDPLSVMTGTPEQDDPCYVVPITSLTVVLMHCIKCPFTIQNIPDCTSPPKLHHTTTVIPPHHEDFCWHCWITSIMANTIATPGLLQLPSSQHCLRSYCCLVWSNLQLFQRFGTISTMLDVLWDECHMKSRENGVLCTMSLFQY